MTRERWWLRLLSSCVPRDDRDAWMREWRAELDHASPDAGARTSSSASSGSRRATRVFIAAAEDAVRMLPGRLRAVAWMPELRFALRSLRRNPGYALAAVLTLGLGIGANTAIFSVVNGYLLEPLPFPEPDRLVALVKSRGEQVNLTSAPNFLDWREAAGAFEDMAAAHQWPVNVTSIDVPHRVARTRVTAGFFEILGVRPIVGRTFDEVESTAGGSAVAILAHDFWAANFGSDPSVVGRSIDLDGITHTIIGVMPPSFRLAPLTAAIWVPLPFDADAISARGRNNLFVIGRLKAGLSIDAAQPDLRAIGDRLARDYPPANEGWTVRAMTLRELAVGASSRAVLWKLLAGVGLVLLIACVNVANLVIARGIARRRELAVRVAMGASRSRLLAQMMTESIVLGIAGGALGLGMAVMMLGPIRSLVPASLSGAGDVSLDGAVLAFTFVASLATGLLAGLLPAIRSSRVARSGVRAAGVAGLLRSRGGTQTVRASLAAAQFALATILLVAAGLVLRSLARLYAVDVGVLYEGVTSFGVTFPEAVYPAPARVIAAIDGVVERLAATSGMQSVAAVSHLPLSGARLGSGITYEGGPAQQSTGGPSAAIKVITRDYFDVMGIEIVAGRPFDDPDDEGGEQVAIINQAAASAWWPGEDPIGRWVAYAPGPDGQDVRRRIVGVIADVHFAGPSVSAQPEVYEAHRQTTEVWRWFGRAMTFVVRTSDGRLLGIESVREAVGGVDPRLPIVRHTRLADVLDQSLATPRFHGALLQSFAALALVLAVIGMYGVLAFAVRQRAREVGIRMALGARRASIVASVLRDGFRLAGAGGLVGLLGAFALSHSLRVFVWGIEPTDPVTYMAAIGVLGVATLLASWIPARLAAAVDPSVTLRGE